MTVQKTVKIKKEALIYTAAFFISVAVTLVLALLMNDVLSEGVRGGLILSWKVVIPSVFPFMIISDLISYVFDRMNEESPLINCGVKICIIGFLCGFPCGAKRSAAAYRSGEVEKCSAITYAAASSVPSPAFIVAGVKSALGLSASQSVIALISTALAGAVIIRAFRKNSPKSIISHVNPRQKYNFVASVKDAGLACVTVCAFVTLFFTVSKILSFAGINSTVLTSVLPFLEVSAALNSVVYAGEMPRFFKALCVGFSLGFGGISAILQCGVYLEEAGLSIKKFITVKLLMGVITAIIFTLLLYIFK